MRLFGHHWGEFCHNMVLSLCTSMSTLKKNNPRRIVFVAVGPVEEVDLFGPVTAFHGANRCQSLQQYYRVEIVCGGAGAEVAGHSGMSLMSSGSCFALQGPIDTLVVVSGRSAEQPHAPELLAWLKGVAPHVRRVVSICTGAFVLAQSGLLDGRRATTHWDYAARLAERFPSIDVAADAIWLRDGKVYTSAGVTAGIDLALALIEQDVGGEVALEVARGLVVFLHRPGGQAQFSVAIAQRQAALPTLRELQGWLAEHLAEDLNVELLAERMAMSPRHFARVFKRELGVTPAIYVQNLRLEQARCMLEKNQHSMKQIAALCGFSGVQLMRRALKNAFGVTPGQYRARFHDGEGNHAGPVILG